MPSKVEFFCNTMVTIAKPELDVGIFTNTRHTLLCMCASHFHWTQALDYQFNLYSI